MKTLATVLTLMFIYSAHAEPNPLEQLLKGVKPKPSSEQGTPQPQQGSKTERLIFGGLKAVKGLMPIGYDEEVAIGGAVALEAIARFGGLWENPAVEKYVATVGAAVALTSDRPEIPYYFGILNADEPNAFACPGGYIFITKGLLKLVQNEAQLAGILGHEIAHVTKKHALEAIRRSKALGGISEVTLTALDKDPGMFDAVVKETSNLLFERGIGKAKELEADSVGTDFALRVGYQPRALRSFLEVLGPHMKDPKNPLYKTHPNTRERVVGLGRVLASPQYAGTQTFPLLPERFAQNLTGVSL